MGNINELLEDKVFSEWKCNEDIPFTKDGILFKKDSSIDVESLWAKEERRIVFLLKDQPSSGCDDLRYWLSGDSERCQDNRALLGTKGTIGSKRRTQFFPNIAKIIWGVYTARKPEDCSYDVMDAAFRDGTITKFVNQIPFALVESKKICGGTSLSDVVLKKTLEKDGDLLRKELQILDPNIIICSNAAIRDKVLSYYPQSELIEIHRSLHIHPQSGTMICLSWHPSARKSKQDIYRGVLDHFEKFLHSEYSLNFHFHPFKGMKSDEL